jgi:predicted molibdopterin-dependent oxidoreductase YjgC
VCRNHEDCEKVRHGEYKAGRVIGCYTCSHKDTCEIRELSEYLRVKEIRYPQLYKNLPLERDDPFLVRDYNLCILCARCVRACQDVLGHSAIALTKRGHDTKIGTISEVSHLESGCAFCGHCIDVCPTGALIARGSSWFGTPDKSIETTCNLCSHGCQMVVDVKWDKVVNVRPPSEMSARREYCVKGRFCIPALMNGQNRLKYPMIKRKVIKEEQYPVTWNEAISHVAEILKSTEPKDIGFIISPFLTDESIYLMNKLAKELGIKNIAYNDDDIHKFATENLKVIFSTYYTDFLKDLNTVKKFIHQDIYSSHFSENAEVIFPTTTFTEEDGTKTGTDYIRNEIHKAVPPPGEALPGWVIVCKIGEELNLEGFRYDSIRDLQDEILGAEPLEVPLVSKQRLDYMGIPIGEKVDDFQLYLDSKRLLNKSKGKGKVDVQI